jgi:hypothetical protein
MQYTKDSVTIFCVYCTHYFSKKFIKFNNWMALFKYFQLYTQVLKINKENYFNVYTYTKSGAFVLHFT